MWTAFLTAVLVLAASACARDAGPTAPPGSLGLALSVAVPEMSAVQAAGIAAAFDAADEVFVFVGAFPDGFDTLAILENLEERAVRDGEDLIFELENFATILQASWFPLGEGGRVRLDLLAPESDASVVVLALVARERRVLFAGASDPVRLRVSPPPQVGIPLTPLAWDIRAVPEVIDLPGPGATADLDVEGTFFTGDPLSPLPPGAEEWNRLDGLVEVLDEERGVIRALLPGTARVEVENDLHGFSLADDGGPEFGRTADTVLVRIGGR
jgi:hypothetical protein